MSMGAFALIVSLKFMKVFSRWGSSHSKLRWKKIEEIFEELRSLNER